MTKGLEALKKLKNYRELTYVANITGYERVNCKLAYNDELKGSFATIEKELKEKQEQDEILTHYGLSSKDLVEACKHLKAIKNGDFGLFFEDYENQKKALEIIKNIGILEPYEMSSGQCWLETNCDATKITKDNYDLLKEVLL